MLVNIIDILRIIAAIALIVIVFTSGPVWLIWVLATFIIVGLMWSLSIRYNYPYEDED